MAAFCSLHCFVAMLLEDTGLPVPLFPSVATHSALSSEILIHLEQYLQGLLNIISSWNTARHTGTQVANDGQCEMLLQLTALVETFICRRPGGSSDELEGFLTALPLVQQKTAEDTHPTVATKLQRQNNQCMGCGVTIGGGNDHAASNRRTSILSVFAISTTAAAADFVPCGYYKGLFCQRWCHRSDRRPLPQRMFTAWDCTPQLVSKQASYFIDSMWRTAVFDARIDCSVTVRRVPLLCIATEMRTQIIDVVASLLGREHTAASAQQLLRLLKALFSPDTQESIDSSTISSSRVHLLKSAHQYTLQDLANLHSGALVPELQSILNSLLKKY